MIETPGAKIRENFGKSKRPRAGMGGEREFTGSDWAAPPINGWLFTCFLM